MSYFESLGSLTPEIRDELTDMVDRHFYNMESETVSASGALSVTKRTTYLSVTGSKVYTLADGTWEGQQKLVYCTVAAGGPSGVLTPANLGNGTSFTFDAVSESVLLEWHTSTGWIVIDVQGTAVA